MKKSIITTILIFASIGVFGQATKTPIKELRTNTVDTLIMGNAAPKVKYEYFVKVAPNDIQQFLNLLNDYRRLTTYDPNLKPDQAVQAQKQIDLYIKDLQTRLKIDSVKIVKP